MFHRHKWEVIQVNQGWGQHEFLAGTFKGQPEAMTWVTQRCLKCQSLNQEVLSGHIDIGVLTAEPSTT